MRKTLNDEQIHPTMRDQINSFHADIVAELAVLRAERAQPASEHPSS